MRRLVWMTIVVQGASAAAATGQPWVPPRGEGTVSATYQNYYVVGHFDAAGRPNVNGATHARALVTDLDIGLTDNFGLTLSLPYIATKYTGPTEYFVGGFATHPGPQDDRMYHGTFQDVRIEARRVWFAGPVAVAPLAAVILPTHDYETDGEAVAGRHRRELQAGATAGVDLNRIVPRTYTYARYSLNAAEQIEGFPSIRSSIDLDADFDVTSVITINGLAAWQLRHKGPTVRELAAADWLGHDRFIVPSYFNLGGGLTLYITRSTELHALWVATVSGRNGAHQARMLSIGTTWSFGGGMGGFGGPTAARKERSR